MSLEKEDGGQYILRVRGGMTCHSSVRTTAAVPTF